MNCDDIKGFFVDYIYDELSKDDSKLFEQHIKKCKTCKEELAALQSTSNILKQWKDFDPKMNLIFVQEKKSLLRSLIPNLNWSNLRLKKLAGGLAIGLASVLVILAFTNTKITINNGNFEFSASLFSKAKSPDDVIPISTAALSQLQQTNLILFQELIKESENRQRQAIVNTLSEILKNVDYQRSIDMQLFGQGLEEIEVNTIRRLERTDQKLDSFIRYISQDGSIKR